jgi:hypothetical protein
MKKYELIKPNVCLEGSKKTRKNSGQPVTLAKFQIGDLPHMEQYTVTLTVCSVPDPPAVE